MIVREFVKEDKEIFLELCEMFYGSSAVLRGFDRQMAEKTFSRILDRHENLWGYLFFDKEANLPMGYALVTSYWCNEAGGEMIVLDEIFLNPISQHKGYAKLFMGWLEEQFSDAAAITLEVLAGNTHAREFYEKIGFTPDGFISYEKKTGKHIV